MSKVTNMAAMFRDAVAFNQPIGTKDISAGDSPTGEAYTAWNVSNVLRRGRRRNIPLDDSREAWASRMYHDAVVSMHLAYAI